MKKFISLMLCLCFAFSLTACKKEDKSDTINFNNVTSSQSANSEKNTDTSSEVDTSDNEVSISTDTETVLSQLVENNEALGEIVEDAKKMLNVESFSFEAKADIENISEGTEEEYLATGIAEFDKDSNTVKMQINYKDTEIIVLSAKDDTFIATRSGDDGEWEIEDGDDPDDDNYIGKLVGIIKYLRDFSSEESMDFSSVVNKVFEYLGLESTIDAKTLNDFAMDIVKSFTSKENLNTLLGYSKSDNTDGTTYTIHPDLVACTDELIVLMEPLFEDEQKYNSFSSIILLQQFALMSTDVSIKLKLDDDKSLKNVTLDFSSAETYELFAELNITDVNVEKIKIDSELQSIIDNKE